MNQAKDARESALESIREVVRDHGGRSVMLCLEHDADGFFVDAGNDSVDEGRLLTEDLAGFFREIAAIVESGGK